MDDVSNAIRRAKLKAGVQERRAEPAAAPARPVRPAGALTEAEGVRLKAQIARERKRADASRLPAGPMPGVEPLEHEGGAVSAGDAREELADRVKESGKSRAAILRDDPELRERLIDEGN